MGARFVYPEGQVHPDHTICCPCRPALTYEGPKGDRLVCTHHLVDPELLKPQPVKDYPVPGASYQRSRPWEGRKA